MLQSQILKLKNKKHGKFSLSKLNKNQLTPNRPLVATIYLDCGQPPTMQDDIPGKLIRVVFRKKNLTWINELIEPSRVLDLRWSVLILMRQILM